jgi:hypothetical protein
MPRRALVIQEHEDGAQRCLKTVAINVSSAVKAQTFEPGGEKPTRGMDLLCVTVRPYRRRTFRRLRAPMHLRLVRNPG